MKTINNTTVNHLALTSMIKAGKISSILCGTYSEWCANGWQFFFELKNDRLYSVMQGVFPHGTERNEVECDKYITDEVYRATKFSA